MKAAAQLKNLGRKVKEVTSPSHASPTSPPSMTAVTSPGTAAAAVAAAHARKESQHSMLTTNPAVRAGCLVIRVVEAKGLQLSEGVAVPDRIQKALQNDPAAQSSASVVGGSGDVIAGVNSKVNNRMSMQRKHKWWLPYCILTYDKNEILVDAVGGDMQNPSWMYRADFDVSRAADVTISAYLRTSPANDRNDMGNDYLLGTATFPPLVDANRMSDEWIEATTGVGSFRVQVMYKQTPNEPLTIDSFELLKVIGKGSFGKVMQVRKKDTQRIYALKTIRKAHIVSRSEVTHTLAERTVLAQISNPFIVPLKFCFQNPDKLYLVLAFVNGGELFHHLQREGRFSEERSRFYTAELLSALECLHSMDVVYRDLKPENILLDYTGHIALCDFGLCKLNMGEDERTNTFCGTPEYLAPEVIKGEGYGKAIDWWTLGILLFEMLSGLPPYYDESHNVMYRRILKDPLVFPAEIRTEARSLLTGLLDRNPSTRLGAGPKGADDIKKHAFFTKTIDWERLNLKGYRPPFKPSVESVADASNFDSEFTSEMPMDSVVEDSHLSETVQQQFAGFTFNPTGEFMSESVR